MTDEKPVLTVARVDDSGRVVVARDEFRDTWDDGTVVEDIHLRKSPDGWRLLVRGKKNGNCQMIQTPVDFTPEGAVSVRDAAAWDRCTGQDGCGTCELQDAGAVRCKCTTLQGSCNHSTGTGLDDLPIFLKAVKKRA